MIKKPSQQSKLLLVARGFDAYWKKNERLLLMCKIPLLGNLTLTNEQKKNTSPKDTRGTHSSLRIKMIIHQEESLR